MVSRKNPSREKNRQTIRRASKKHRSNYADKPTTSRRSKKKSTRTAKKRSKKHQMKTTQLRQTIGRFIFSLNQIAQYLLRVTLLMCLGFVLVYGAQYAMKLLGQSEYNSTWQQLKRRFADEDIPKHRQKKYQAPQTREKSNLGEKAAPNRSTTRPLYFDHQQRRTQDRAEKKAPRPVQYESDRVIHRDNTPKKRKSIQKINSIVDNLPQ